MVTTTACDATVQDQMLTQGYAVLKDFLSPDLLQTVVDKYNSEAKEFPDYKMVPLGDDFIKEHLGGVIDATLQDIKSDDYHPDQYGKGVFFATGTYIFHYAFEPQ